VLSDRAAAPSDADVESHIEECAVCREELERLAAGPEWWENAQSFLSDELHRKDLAAESFAVNPPIESGGSAADRVQIASWLPAGLLEPSSDPAKIGRIGQYEIVDFVGRGGMGVVFKAFDAALNRYVALKVMASELAHSSSARRRFAREAQAAAAVVHDHVVPIYAVDGAGPVPYLVMAYIPGHSLQERIDQSGPLEVREILRIGMQTAAGLAAAHAQGLVHRDIKPANILLENGVERVRITDFGLARAMDEASQTQSGVLAGTPQYMAPEQASGEAIDYRTDLFSLGSVMYAMCTGHSPFRAETTVAVLRRICDGTPRPVREVNADVPIWLAAIIEKLLSKRPGDRFGSAEEVARLLAEHLAQVQQPERRRSRWQWKRLSVWAACAPAVVAAALFAAQQFGDGEKAANRTKEAVSREAGSTTVNRPGTAGRPPRTARSAGMPVDDFQAALQALDRDLSGLEQVLWIDGRATQRDALQEIFYQLDAIEHQLGSP
jgi:serine/threonine-protein kinase